MINQRYGIVLKARPATFALLSLVTILAGQSALAADSVASSSTSPTAAVVKACVDQVHLMAPTTVAVYGDKDFYRGFDAYLNPSDGKVYNNATRVGDQRPLFQFQKCMAQGGPTEAINGKARSQPPSAAARMIGACVYLAANTYHIPPAALMGIYQVEKGELGHEYLEKNKTHGIGPMKINDSLVPELAKKWDVSRSKARTLVRNDVCTNVGVAAWILSQKLHESGNIGTAIGGYADQWGGNSELYKEQVVKAISTFQFAPGAIR